MSGKSILCIDLKSFFASVECVERGLDPFTTPLVVADKTRGNGAITLAVTPYMKKLGVKSRGRLYEIPHTIKNIIYAKPKMSLYLKKSEEIINIYMDFISDEDMHVYSIDEVFLDVTKYLKMYKMSDYELALKIMSTIKEKTKITSCCGIGPNLLLAKVALDTEAKITKDGIAKWTMEDVKTKLWEITPLDDMWGIGAKTREKLESLGIKKIGDINKYDIAFYKKRFGIIGEDIYLHANGIDTSTINSFNYQPKSKSYGLSQILYTDYTPEKAILIINEMASTIAQRLKNNNKVTKLINFGIGYSKEIGGGFNHSTSLQEYTDEEKTILQVCLNIFDSYIEDLPIRKISISLGKIESKTHHQLNLFEISEENIEHNKLNDELNRLKNKYGNNTVLMADSLLEYSTIKRRNNTLGGHNKD